MNCQTLASPCGASCRPSCWCLKRPNNTTFTTTYSATKMRCSMTMTTIRTHRRSQLVCNWRKLGRGTLLKYSCVLRINGLLFDVQIIKLYCNVWPFSWVTYSTSIHNLRFHFCFTPQTCINLSLVLFTVHFSCMKFSLYAHVNFA